MPHVSLLLRDMGGVSPKHGSGPPVIQASVVRSLSVLVVEASWWRLPGLATSARPGAPEFRAPQFILNDSGGGLKSFVRSNYNQNLL